MVSLLVSKSSGLDSNSDHGHRFVCFVQTVYSHVHPGVSMSTGKLTASGG